jgi:hypothetical protein
MGNSFLRTASGINNSRHFYGVDVILYCEGGGGDYNISDILENKYCDNSNDILFWEKVLNEFKPNIKVKIKSIGSNTVVTSMRNHILENNIPNNYVAIDRDYKHMNISNYSISDIELISYGYSWENDVWNTESALKIYQILTGTQHNISVENEFQNLFKKFERQLSKIITLDINLSTHHKESAFQKNPKKCCARFIKQTGKPKPILKEFLKDGKLLKTRLNSKISFNYLITSNFSMDCQGHLLAEIYYRIIVYLVQKKIKKRKIEKEIVYGMVINNLFKNNPLIYEHYKEITNKIA